jgi:hypothetical protein
MGRGRGGGGRFNRDEGPPSEIVGAYGFWMILYYATTLWRTSSNSYLYRMLFI